MSVPRSFIWRDEISLEFLLLEEASLEEVFAAGAFWELIVLPVAT